MPELAIGSVFAGHRIDALVGQGGMGVVYRATHLALDRPVALKLITPDLGADEAFRERFRRESRIAAALDHPHVVTVHHAGEEDGTLFITMRYVAGDDLRTIIEREGRLEAGRAAELVRQTGEALDAAHGRGLVHRDVKPGNILIAREGGREHVYLTDFGLTKRDTSLALTNTGEIVGTLDYIAPEQIRGERVDSRTDVYGLGCVLFHAVTGRVPYTAEHYAAKVFAHLGQPPPEMASLVPGVPPALEGVVRRALEKDPDARFQTAGELGDAAAAAVARAEPAATQPRPVPTVSAPVVEEPEPEEEPAARSRLPAGKPVIALVAVLAALAIAAGFLLARGSGDEVTTEEAETVLATVQAATTNGDSARLERVLAPDYTRKLLADEPVGRGGALENFRAAFKARGETPRYALEDVRITPGENATATARYSFTGAEQAQLGDYGETLYRFEKRDGRVVIVASELYPDIVTPLPETLNRSDYPLQATIKVTTEVPGGSRVPIAEATSRIAKPPDAVKLPLTPTGRRVLHSGQKFTIEMMLRLADGTRQPVVPSTNAFNPGPATAR